VSDVTAAVVSRQRTNLMPFLQQRFGNVTADEATRTGDQNPIGSRHFRVLCITAASPLLGAVDDFAFSFLFKFVLFPAKPYIFTPVLTFALKISVCRQFSNIAYLQILSASLAPHK
jgi:hypothetical protein